ncbi:hypothetical protein HNR42_003458 [Deinobacterium chartae]|uniref:Serine active site containing 1-like protein n=1 Tax=Deinobacterium chartae TaxID=521158 RepID=A0A841I2T7_9DEIO|nr:hypothetical protein [Deinobacterium chartae]MBB6099997.1 hypothetical protein [Deinobacterium chartae]
MTERAPHSRSVTATHALWGGLLFSLAFTAAISLLGERLQGVPHLPDRGASWYYWKLPEPTFASRVSAWTLYALHQLTLWGLIWYAQTRVRTYTQGLHRINVIALAANAVFALLHLAQTHLWYDGLAQDVSIYSSQGSVILLLVFVLIMENRRRGMFFGKAAPLAREAVDFVRRYHGYFFAWAAVYTFWYHPAEASSGHLIGFLYTLMIMLQGSLFFTRVHVNRLWTLTLEVIVLVHGTLVAIMQGNDLWPMFAFGFGGIFIITQMHGLGWSRLTRAVVAAAYLALVAWVYAGRGWEKLNEIVRIPMIDYLLVFVLTWLVGGGLWLWRRLRLPRSTPKAAGDA